MFDQRIGIDDALLHALTLFDFRRSLCFGVCFSSPCLVQFLVERPHAVIGLLQALPLLNERGDGSFFRGLIDEGKVIESERGLDAFYGVTQSSNTFGRTLKFAA